METVEDLKRRIRSTEDLQSVVKTMKAMAAVKIRQYEEAVESLQDYARTIELGLRAVLSNQPGIMVEVGSAAGEDGRRGVRFRPGDVRTTERSAGYPRPDSHGGKFGVVSFGATGAGRGSTGCGPAG
ncbi:MAG: F0F1 ATP synthase subunit gamma [Deltaproteobacteria bacterium]|nr:F0F1 ATP synthase subunit gamma [Deltaproteobacteria bacterium]